MEQYTFYNPCPPSACFSTAFSVPVCHVQASMPTTPPREEDDDGGEEDESEKVGGEEESEIAERGGSE